MAAPGPPRDPVFTFGADAGDEEAPPPRTAATNSAANQQQQGTKRKKAGGKQRASWGETAHWSQHKCQACSKPTTALVACCPQDPWYACLSCVKDKQGRDLRIGTRCSLACRRKSKHKDCKAPKRSKKASASATDGAGAVLAAVTLMATDATVTTSVADAAGVTDNGPAAGDRGAAAAATTAQANASGGVAGGDVPRAPANKRRRAAIPMAAAAVAPTAPVTMLCPYCAVTVAVSGLRLLPSGTMSRRTEGDMVCATCAVQTWCVEPNCLCRRDGEDRTALCHRHRGSQANSPSGDTIDMDGDDSSDGDGGFFSDAQQRCMACVRHKHQIRRHSKSRMAQRKLDLSADQILTRQMMNLSVLSAAPAPTAPTSSSWFEAPLKTYASIFALAVKWKKQNKGKWLRLNQKKAIRAAAQQYAERFRLRGRKNTQETPAEQFLRLYAFLTLKSTVGRIRQHFDKSTDTVDWHALIQDT